MKSRVLSWLRGIICQAATAHVVLDRGGQMTDDPKVHVSFTGRSAFHSGTCGALTFPDTDQGNAQAEMYGRMYSEILSIPLTDRRER